MSRELIINADDFGLSPGVNRGIVEAFREGVSHGTRIRWYSDGTKESEGEIVNGEFEGPFRRWNEAGILTSEIWMKHGVPHGLARLWNAQGDLQREVEMRNGQEVNRREMVATEIGNEGS